MAVLWRNNIPQTDTHVRQLYMPYPTVLLTNDRTSGMQSLRSTFWSKYGISVYFAFYGHHASDFRKESDKVVR